MGNLEFLGRAVTLLLKLMIQVAILALFAVFLPWIFWPIFIIWLIYIFFKWLLR